MNRTRLEALQEVSRYTISSGFLFPSGSLQTQPPHLRVEILAPSTSLISP